MDPGIVARLEAIAGCPNVLTTADDLVRYSSDETPHATRHQAQAIVLAENTNVVAGVLRLASELRIPVTPRGSGTGLSGGCVPLYGGIVLSLEKMKRILEIDEANRAATVEAGVTLGELQQAAESHGLYYPVYPGEKGATLGGNIATNAGGMRAVRYGVTRHFVLGLEAVLSGGQILSLGGKLVKCSSGYDLAQLLIGSEGTLAVITRAVLKLGTLPTSREVLLVPFPALEPAIEAVPDILNCPTIPVGLEFMEEDIIRIVEEDTGRKLPMGRHPAFLMLILEGQSPEEVLEACRNIEKVVREHQAIDVFVPPSDRARRELLEFREKFFPAIKRLRPIELIDTVVPRSAIPRFLTQVKALAQRHGIEVIAYGHAGDGNVHLHPIGRGLNNEEWRKRLPELMEDIYRSALEMGGAISGEHGIGLDKKAYFERLSDLPALNVMRKIKCALDPENILNPGKIFSM